MRALGKPTTTTNGVRVRVHNIRVRLRAAWYLAVDSGSCAYVRACVRETVALVHRLRRGDRRRRREDYWYCASSVGRGRNR